MSISQNVFFGRQQLEYLGHIIFIEGMVADPSKVESMLSWPRPTTVSGPRGFLGLIGCYHRFVRNYGKICEPFNELLKRDNFLWNEEAENAFNQLKQAMTALQCSSASYADFSKEFVIECDEFGTGLGAVRCKVEDPSHMQVKLYLIVTWDFQLMKKSCFQWCLQFPGGGYT